MNLAERVYRQLCKVPSGKVTTYGELAKSVGLKNGQRAIGRIMAQNPYPGIVPCHRVIKSDGKLGGYMYGLESKIQMLKNEGVIVKDGKIVGFDDAVFRF